MALKFSSRLRRALRNSAQGNFSAADRYEIPMAATFEGAVFGLFKINIVNLVKIKASLAKNFRLQPSEIDAMPFWEYELFIRNINEQVEAENKEQEEQMKKYHMEEHLESTRPGKMEKTMSSMTPKMPDFSNMKMNMKF